MLKIASTVHVCALSKHCLSVVQCQGSCNGHSASLGGADWDERMAGRRGPLRGVKEGKSLPTPRGT